MKNFYYAILVATVLLFGGCKGVDDAGDDPSIIVDAESFTIDNAAVTKSIVVTSNTDWTVSGATDWCAVSPLNGSKGTTTVTVSIAENKTYDDRSCQLQFAGANVASKPIIITQEQLKSVQCEDQTIEVAAAGKEFSVTVKHNVDYTVEISADWIVGIDAKALTTDNLTFKVAENTTSENRSATITIAGAGHTATITVNQSAPVISFVDSAVEALCLANFDSNKDGKLTTAELASVKNLGAIFKRSNITSFDELKYFTSLTSMSDSVFLGCTALTSITIPGSVTSIDDYAFYECSGLTSITFPNSLTSIGEYAFLYCSTLTSITIPNGVISIDAGAFAGCIALTSITLPNSLTSIGGAAFSGCAALRSITIPSSITSINGGTFAGCCSLASITIPNSVTLIGGVAFQECSSLTSITIPSGVKSIGDGTFIDCTALKSVNIPSGVKSIGVSAFNNCRELTSITIPNDITLISSATFYKCSSLTSITIPSGVKSIGNYAFSDCSSLASVYCKATVPPEIDNGMIFSNNAGGRRFYVPSASVDTYKNKLWWNTYSDFIVGYDF